MSDGAGDLLDNEHLELLDDLIHRAAWKPRTNYLMQFVNLCFGAWLYPGHAAEPHTVDLESTTVE